MGSPVESFPPMKIILLPQTVPVCLDRSEGSLMLLVSTQRIEPAFDIVHLMAKYFLQEKVGETIKGEDGAR